MAEVEAIADVITGAAVARGVEPAAVEAEMASARGYGDLKAATAEAVIAMLAPVRERYEALRADEAELERILGVGAEKARAIAAGTLADVRRVMGVGRPPG